MANPAVAAQNRARPSINDFTKRSAGRVVSHPVLSVFLLAGLVRIALVVLSESFEGFVLDDGTYHRLATDMASGDISHWDDFTYSLFWRTAAFLGPVTLLYQLFGPEILVGQFYVAIVGATTAAVGTRLAMEFLPLRWAIFTGIVLALMPSQAFWSSQLMKDASVWLALVSLALAISFANRATGRVLVAWGLAVLVGLSALAFLREHTLVVAAWSVLIASLGGLREGRWVRITGAFALAIAVPWVVAGVGPGGFTLVSNAGSLDQVRFKMAQGANTAIVDTTPGGTESELNALVRERQEVEKQISEVEQRAATAADPVEKDTLEQQAARLRDRQVALVEEQERIQNLPQGGSVEGAATLEGEAGLEPSVKHLPRGLSVMLLEPFPLPFEGSASLRLARLESLIWYPLVILAAVGLWHSRKHPRDLLFPIFVGGGILVMYALSEGNVGTAHRHRGEFVWVVVLLAALRASRVFGRSDRVSESGNDAVSDPQRVAAVQNPDRLLRDQVPVD